MTVQGVALWQEAALQSEAVSVWTQPPWAAMGEPGTDTGHCSDTLRCWQVDSVVQMFDILRKEGTACVQQEDLKSMMAGILLSHPGLEFLQETPEFQDRCCLGFRVEGLGLKPARACSAP